MNFEEIQGFKKDLKKLSKKYRSLPEDLQVVKKVLRAIPDQRPPFSFRLEGLGIQGCVIKVKKIACKSIRGRGVNSGLRLIYAYFSSQTRIVFLELYHKSEKDTEDRNRIKKYFI